MLGITSLTYVKNYTFNFYNTNQNQKQKPETPFIIL